MFLIRMGDSAIINGSILAFHVTSKQVNGKIKKITKSTKKINWKLSKNQETYSVMKENYLSIFQLIKVAKLNIL